MSEDLPSVTKADVCGLATEQSFDRGINYYHSGAIFEPVRQGNELRACCQGSSYEPYRVTATLGPQGIMDAHCTCPYDWGGVCKHIVALLLSWIHAPETFHTVAPLEEMLAGRSREELVSLIKEMLKRERDLIRLLELPLQSGRETPLDPDAFRRQIDYALRREFPDAEGLATELAAIIDTGDRFQEAEDWANAGAVYHLVLDEIVARYQDLYDEDGDIVIELQRCAEGLDVCLTEGSHDAETRRAWLEALLETELKDVEMGGIDLAHPASDVIIRHATKEEWAGIEARVRRAIDTHKRDRYSQWGREALVRFLMQRLQEPDREAEADELVFELGSPEQRAFLMVRQGRFTKAVTVAQRHFVGLSGLIERFADALVEAGANEIAKDYVISQLDSQSKTFYLSWLAAYAEKQGDLTAALDWWRQRFTESPDLHTFQAIRNVANRLNLVRDVRIDWDQVRSELLESLETGQQWTLLLEIALEEKDALRALDLLPRVGRGWYGGDYEVRVARLVESDHPQAALDIYSDRVERLIRARGRGKYQTASSLLTRMRDLYRRRRSGEDWDRYVGELRQRHRRLRALQDELNKAGL